MSKLRVAVLGGTGFIGRSLCERLVADGHEVRILTRRRERHRDLLVLPSAQVVDADVHNPVVLKREFQGLDAVVNLVGILNESGRAGKGFEFAHVELPAKVVQACRQTGVPRLLHMSALHAAPDAPSNYLRSKGRGEKIVHEAHSNKLQVTSFRPSVIFGLLFIESLWLTTIGIAAGLVFQWLQRQTEGGVQQVQREVRAALARAVHEKELEGDDRQTSPGRQGLGQELVGSPCAARVRGAHPALEVRRAGAQRGRERRRRPRLRLEPAGLSVLSKVQYILGVGQSDGGRQRGGVAHVGGYPRQAVAAGGRAGEHGRLRARRVERERHARADEARRARQQNARAIQAHFAIS